MRKGGGKQKGAAFERHVCQQLSLWLSRGKRKDLLWRSAMSGGRATVSHRKGDILTSQGGDVSAIDPLGAILTDRFCIEIKFYKDLDLHAFWLGYGTLYAFWMRACTDAKRYGKEPMLIAKQNMYKTIVLVRPGVGVTAADESIILWRSERFGATLGDFEDMLRVPYKGPAVERWRPRPR